MTRDDIQSGQKYVVAKKIDMYTGDAFNPGAVWEYTGRGFSYGTLYTDWYFNDEIIDCVEKVNAEGKNPFLSGNGADTPRGMVENAPVKNIDDEANARAEREAKSIVDAVVEQAHKLAADIAEQTAAALHTPGAKADTGKVRFDLIPERELLQVVTALNDGAVKYSDFGWQQNPNGKRDYYNALMRHRSAYLRGERLDPESGSPHLAHVVVNALFLLYFDNEEAEK